MAEFLVQEKVLEELVAENSEKEDKKEISEKIEEFIETEIQEFEPEIISEFEHEVNYGGGFIDNGQEIKNYHYDDVIKKIDVTPRGDSYDNMIISYETEVLAEGQQIIADQRDAEMSNKAYLEIDMRRKDVKADISIINHGEWLFMCETRSLTFN